VHHVAPRIEQNVSIVSVFDLQNVAEERVAGHRLHEGQPRLLQSLLSGGGQSVLGGSGPSTIGGDEVGLQVGEVREGLLQFVNRNAVGDGLYQAAVVASGYDVEGFQP
jgi:hypothetical protein